MRTIFSAFDWLPSQRIQNHSANEQPTLYALWRTLFRIILFLVPPTSTYSLSQLTRARSHSLLRTNSFACQHRHTHTLTLGQLQIMFSRFQNYFPYLHYSFHICSVIHSFIHLNPFRCENSANFDYIFCFALL